jgi:hypothetical protein
MTIGMVTKIISGIHEIINTWKFYGIAAEDKDSASAVSME